jgi:mRNA-degrading endonuclease RelE of RelBE toxin-antitoxin system
VTREILLSSQAQRDYAALEKDARHRARAGLLRFAETGRGDLKRFKGVGRGTDLFRLRIGVYRIVLDQTVKETRVTRIFRRGEGYEWL